MTDRANIVVKRVAGFPHRFAPYEVRIDGIKIGGVKAYESLTLMVDAGRHRISVSESWCRSEEVEFEAADSETIQFECGCRLTGWRMALAAFYIIFRPKGYFWIRVISRHEKTNDPG